VFLTKKSRFTTDW